MLRTVGLMLLTLTILMSADIRSHCQSVANFNNDLTGWWRGEDNANDSHSGRHGTWEGREQYGPGKVGKAFKFRNSGAAPYSAVLLDNSPRNQFLPTAEGTVALWVDWDPFPNSNPPISGGGIFGGCYVSNPGASCSSRTPILQVNDYRLGWWFGNSKYSNPKPFTDNLDRCHGWYPLPKSALTPSEQWHHVALTYARTSNSNYRIAFYVNGRRVGGDCNSALSLGNEVMFNNIAIGRAQNVAIHGFTGLIDEVRTYRRALTEAEVEAIYKYER